MWSTIFYLYSWEIAAHPIPVPAYTLHFLYKEHYNMEIGVHSLWYISYSDFRAVRVIGASVATCIRGILLVEMLEGRNSINIVVKRVLFHDRSQMILTDRFQTVTYSYVTLRLLIHLKLQRSIEWAWPKLVCSFVCFFAILNVLKPRRSSRRRKQCNRYTYHNVRWEQSMYVLRHGIVRYGTYGRGQLQIFCGSWLFRRVCN